MKLYVWGVAPNPRRVKIYLAEKGLSVPIEDAGIPDQAALKPEFLEGGPHRRVPLLVLDDGTQIGEAMAICRYFETLNPEPSLMGTDALERATIEMWERTADNDGMNAVAEFFRNSRKAFIGRGLSGMPGTVEQIPGLVERGKQRLGWWYEKMDRRLADHEFIAGKKYSVADITALCVFDFAKRVGAEAPAGLANLARWHATVSARPSAKA
jgi:glutathione S-transferase